MRIIFIFSFLLLLFHLNAQDFHVSGTVTSSDDGLPLPGVTIRVEGTTTGTISDINGSFELSVQSGSETLLFSFVGYADQQITIENRSRIDVILQPSSEILDEVVVTALGIERDAKSIGYSIQKIKGDELVIARDESAINQLAGRVSGLTISETNGGAGSSTRILLRGNNSFTNNNQALIVIDGVPIENNTISNAENTWGGRDYGNGVSDINPDDIESVTILKGASASALYGSNAANGVILFTTKQGSLRKGIGITFNTNTSLNKAYIHYDLQNRYGGGRNGQFSPPFNYIEGIPAYDVNNPSAYGSWGPEMNGQEIVDWDGKAGTYSPQNDNYSDYFRNGWTTSNNLAFS